MHEVYLHRYIDIMLTCRHNVIYDCSDYWENDRLFLHFRHQLFRPKKFCAVHITSLCTDAITKSQQNKSFMSWCSAQNPYNVYVVQHYIINNLIWIDSHIFEFREIVLAQQYLHDNPGTLGHIQRLDNVHIYKISAWDEYWIRHHVI